MCCLLLKNGDLHMNPAMQSRLKLVDGAGQKIILSPPLDQDPGASEQNSGISDAQGTRYPPRIGSA